MIEYFIIIFAIIAVAVVVTIVSLCCCGRCGPRKTQETEGDLTEVVLYPETTPQQQMRTHEGNHPYFDEPTADHDRYYSPAQNARYYRVYVRTGDHQLVTAAMAGSAVTQQQSATDGTVVCAPDGMEKAREPVNYGEATYVSRSDSDIPPTTKPHLPEKNGSS